MAQHAHKLVGAEADVTNRPGKLVHVYIATEGNRVWNLRENNSTGKIIYKVKGSIRVSHTNLYLPFAGKLFAEVAEGTTGEINVIYD